MNFFRKKDSTSTDTDIKNSPKSSSLNNTNPYCTETVFKAGKLAFKCPSCQNEMNLNPNSIAPIVGSFLKCQKCKNIVHVPSGYQTSNSPVGLKITGSVQVSITKFGDWYFEHPLITSLIEEGNSDLLVDYGLWGFCAKCNHQYKTTNLSSLPIAQRAGGLVYSARTPESANEMNSLLSGHCPSCGNDYLLVIAAEIPDYVRAAIHDAKG
jgi:hypothetical protein